MKRRWNALMCTVLLISASVSAQDYNAEAKKLMERADVQKAFAHVESHKDDILKEWIQITEINAPSGKEKERAEAVRRILESYKLDKIYYDAKGNLIAIRKGTDPNRKAVVVDAHLDTVFQQG